MRIKSICYLLIGLLFVSGEAMGQSVEEMKTLKKRAAEKVSMLNDYISYMADPKDLKENRLYYKETAEGLFINNCDSIKEIIEYKDTPHTEIILRQGVTMDVSSISKKTIRTKPMKDYFKGLVNLDKIYKAVNIESTDYADLTVSRLRPYGKDEFGRPLYICTVYFDQLFEGYRKDGGVYRDITHKWVVCYVEVDEVIDKRTGGTQNEYMVRLGDVHVESTEAVF